jgi:Uma2 family endonuclease
MSVLEKQLYYSPQEYLALETQAEYKSEYHSGEIFPMVGASINHNRITVNLCTILNSALQDSNYEVFMNDMRVWIPTAQTFFYPDITVIRNLPEFYEDRTNTILNPCLIIEVLSQSTQNYDKGGKFDAYRSIPSFQEYLLVNQYHLQIEQFSKQADKRWLLREYDESDVKIQLVTVDLTIKLVDIYKKVI